MSTLTPPLIPPSNVQGSVHLSVHQPLLHPFLPLPFLPARVEFLEDSRLQHYHHLASCIYRLLHVLHQSTTSNHPSINPFIHPNNALDGLCICSSHPSLHPFIPPSIPPSPVGDSWLGWSAVSCHESFRGQLEEPGCGDTNTETQTGKRRRDQGYGVRGQGFPGFLLSGLALGLTVRTSHLQILNISSMWTGGLS